MNLVANHTELYARLQSFELDKPGHALTFSKRLARDCGWTHEYALLVSEEYKKFVFLMAVAGPVSPSLVIDEAWHLHLLYTRSYWDEMCEGIVGRKLHHNPTEGGIAEKGKFENMYAKTLDTYRELFGMEPPVEIWGRRQQPINRANSQESSTMSTPMQPTVRSLIANKFKLGITLFSVFIFALSGFQAFAQNAPEANPNLAMGIGIFALVVGVVVIIGIPTIIIMLVYRFIKSRKAETARSSQNFSKQRGDTHRGGGSHFSNNNSRPSTSHHHNNYVDMDNGVSYNNGSILPVDLAMVAGSEILHQFNRVSHNQDVNGQPGTNSADTSTDTNNNWNSSGSDGPFDSSPSSFESSSDSTSYDSGSSYDSSSSSDSSSSYDSSSSSCSSGSSCSSSNND